MKGEKKMLKNISVFLVSILFCIAFSLTALADLIQYSTLSEYEQQTGQKIEKYYEAPELAKKVDNGELPPVEERLPQEPVVIEPLNEVGKYGGILRVHSLTPLGSSGDSWSTRRQTLFALDDDLKTITPNIAKGWQLSDDKRTLTVYLRKGMKWSDGHPFTADDIMFWYEDIILNDELTPVKPTKWTVGGKLVEVQKINDYTVSFSFAEPNPSILYVIALGGNTDETIPFAPKHYLKQYHIKYNPEAEQIAQKEGFDSWWKCFQYHYALGDDRQQDVNRPGLDPWVLTEIDVQGNMYFSRNPYYWKVDTEGKQLPYINEQVRMLFEDQEVLNLKIINGEIDYAAADMDFKTFPVFKRNEDKGQYKAMVWKMPYGSIVSLGLNFTIEDPVKRKIFRDLRFRQALSLAIDRENINNTIYMGQAIPRQATTPDNTSFYEPWMGEYYAEYNPEQAMKLLDEMGLKKNKEGFRMRPDGKVLQINFETVEVAGREKICELIAEYWNKIGVKTELKLIQPELYWQKRAANELELGSWDMGNTSELAMYADPLQFRPAGGYSTVSMAWAQWYETGGKEGEEPPVAEKELFALTDQWQKTMPGTKEYMELGKEILSRNVRNLYQIGVVGMMPHPVIKKVNLKNIPDTGYFGWDYRESAPYKAEQWFFE